MSPVDDEKYVVIKEGSLKDLVERTVFCVASEDARPILKGCLIEVKDAIMTASLPLTATGLPYPSAA